MPVPYDGPEYELAARNRPPRLSFFVRRDPYSLRGPAKRDAGSWGAMLVLYDANAHNASRAADEDDADPAKVGFPDFASPLPSASNPQGANATVAVGVLLTDRLTHGSGFRVSPGEHEDGGAGLLGALGAPYKKGPHPPLVIALIGWHSQSYLHQE